MLELRNLKKTYKIGDIETHALDGISVSFRDKEFVAVLGKSGSGKTTFLNMIGGLDRYDSGDLVIKGKKTKDFKENDWDAYRNNSVGFVFQSYNLIMHLGIVANVELAMTLSGVSNEIKHNRAIEVLEQVGLKDHLHKKPSQLSGGQLQRVAIARALANNPEILLCDEPTGALDSATSIQIMDLIKEVSKERLVIIVTHNPELAETYADRIIRFQDGKIIADSHPHKEQPKTDMFNLKKTSMSFFTALKLSANNLKTKKFRTFLTAFASSIGIIGIAVILSLSSGFKTQVDKFQSDALSEFPIMISQNTAEVDVDTLQKKMTAMKDSISKKEETVTLSDEVTLYDPAEQTVLHTNILTTEYMDYLKKIDPKICSSIGYARLASMNLMKEVDGSVEVVSMDSFLTRMSSSSATGMTPASMSGMGLSSYPTQLNKENPSYIEKNYTLLAGEYPKEATDLTLVLRRNNRLDKNILEKLGFDVVGKESIKFSDILGQEFKIITNDNFYTKTEYGNFVPSTDLKKMYDGKGNITIKISGIVRLNDGNVTGLMSPGFAYSDDLTQMVIDSSSVSEIVKAQKESDSNVLTMEAIEGTQKDSFIAYLGGDVAPYMTMIYPKDFTDKDKILAYLDEYNVNKEEKDKVIYTDLAATMSNMTSGIMDAITVVLIAFASISLVVSLIMISIITYTSVLERTKEIGILKALGARKKDISRVFDAETFILGIFSGVLGVVIAWSLTFPINWIIENMTGLPDVSNLPFLYAALLVAISTLLTMLGGHIPAKIASKKEAVEALRESN